MTNAPETLDGVRRDLARALAHIAKKEPEYTKAMDYYNGERTEVHTNPALSSILAKSAEAHPLSFAHIPVDALLDRVELTDIGVEDSDQASDVLEATITQLDYIDEADAWHLQAGIYGDYYVILDPIDEDDEGRSTEISAVGASPTGAAVIYDARDNRLPLFGARVWKEPDAGVVKGQWRATVFYDDCTRHLIGDSGDAASAANFTEHAVGDDPESWSTGHAGGRLLIQHIAIDGRPYGKPLHRRAYASQDALTKINATNLATIDAQGFPARYALLDPSAEADDDDIGDDFGLTDEARDALAGKHGADKRRERTVPGAISILRGVKEVGTFDAAAGDVFLNNSDWHVRGMALATGTPLFEFDMKGDMPSGESRRRAETRINKHARKVCRALAGAHRRIATTLLALAGIDDATVTVTFAPTETATDAEGIELVALKVKNGVPVRNALLEAGYTAEELDKWGWKEGDGARVSTDQVKELAGALQQLGQAVVLGVLTETEARAMLPTILTEARGEGAGAQPDARDVPEVEVVATEDPALIKAKADAV